jgi:hypothetical protein
MRIPFYLLVDRSQKYANIIPVHFLTLLTAVKRQAALRIISPVYPSIIVATHRTTRLKHFITLGCLANEYVGIRCMLTMKLCITLIARHTVCKKVLHVAPIKGKNFPHQFKLHIIQSIPNVSGRFAIYLKGNKMCRCFAPAHAVPCMSSYLSSAAFVIMP